MTEAAVRFLVISDLHGDLDSARAAVDAAEPEALLCCGDWGDPGEVELTELQEFSGRLPVLTVYGNHDHLEALREWRNRDGSPVLLENGVPRRVLGVTVAGINGIWAKSHRKPFYVTDEEVAEAAERLAAADGAEILITHGCPSGVADLTWENRHGGQRCFLLAFQAVRPRLYLTGHLHRAQEHRTRDGEVVRNIGQTPRGDAALITGAPGALELSPLVFR